MCGSGFPVLIGGRSGVPRRVPGRRGPRSGTVVYRSTLVTTVCYRTWATYRRAHGLYVGSTWTYIVAVCGLYGLYIYASVWTLCGLYADYVWSAWFHRAYMCALYVNDVRPCARGSGGTWETPQSGPYYRPGTPGPAQVHAPSNPRVLYQMSSRYDGALRAQ